MKRVDQIEKMSLADLERVSLDESIPVPEGLGERLGEEAPWRSSRGRILWICSAAASLVIIVGLALTLRPRPLEDTFDDPYLAYAEVEKALLRVSGVMETGVQSVALSHELLAKPAGIIRSLGMETTDNR
ncbi:MAG: hypothetical protein IJ840_08380 [Bacteroidales bacterium]|nr:hypothetical protein [Bacteroidales bacterium]